MSDKSFGDYANRNIVKNPLLSTAVTGLSIEDLTHNAVLVPVAPNQGLITGSDQTGTHTQTLANTDHELTNFPSGDSNSNILPPQSSISIHSHTLGSQTVHHHDRKPELPSSTVSKASAKTEDDFDVNEYFARLQGTRYVSAPLHSHPDPNANLAATEENLEEINLNEDKNVEVPQGITADIAQNFSQLPAVLPHVASAVFSSFSNMWNMKSREQTPDAPSYQDVQLQRNYVTNQFQGNQGSQSYHDVQLQGNQPAGPGQFHAANVPSVPLLKTEDVVKEVAPPPKEPPICGTSNFRLTTKKKYAQIPGLSTGESQQIAFNPLTQNVPSYFIPTDEPHKEIEENTGFISQQHSATTGEQNQQNKNETYNIFSPAETDMTAGTSDNQPPVFMPIENHPKFFEEIPSLPQINLQNQMPVIPPPPMFSSPRKDSQTDKSVLPPSVARRIGSNHPVIKQKIMQPTVTDNIFVPSFDAMPAPVGVTEPNMLPASNTAQVPTYSSEMFTPNINQPSQSFQQDITTLPTPNLPPKKPVIPQCSSVLGPPPRTFAPPSSKSIIPPLPGPDPATNLLPLDKIATQIFTPTTTPAIFTPGLPDSGSLVPNSTSLPPTSSIFLPPNLPQTGFPSEPRQLTSCGVPSLPPSYKPTVEAPFASKVCPRGHTYIGPACPNNCGPPLSAASVKDEPALEPPKPPIEPPKAIGTSNFRMTKKKPQYYSGPIEGIGFISNNVKPVIPTIDSGTFHGALFTPEQSQTDLNTPSFDISKQTDTPISYPQFDINNQRATLPAASHQQPTYPSFDATQPSQNYGQQYNTAFDLSRPTTENYDYKEDTGESKGFGIIGSLKSKLSSIDINKIQSKVTTFFDPGYNNTRKDDTPAQEDAPYNPIQHQTHSTNNFEIFVPNVEQSQPYNYNYQADQTGYGQINAAPTKEYNYQHQSIPYVDPGFTYQSYQTNSFTDQAQSINQAQIDNVYAQENPADKTAHEVKSVDTTNPLKHEHEETNKAVPKIPAELAQNAQRVNIPATIDTIPVQKEWNLHYAETKQEEKASLDSKTDKDNRNNKLQSDNESIEATIERLADISILSCQEDDEFINPIASNPIPSAYLPTIDPKSLFQMTSPDDFFSSSQIKSNQSNKPSQPCAFENKSIFSTNVLPPHTVGPFPNVPLDNIFKEKPADIFPKMKRDVKEKEDNPKNLLESLTKGDIPILSVSSVPLFGLSPIIADKSKENSESIEEITLPLAKSIDLLDRNTSTSFFEHFAPPTHDVPTNMFNVNPNVGFFERKASLGKDFGGLDTQLPSDSYFTNESKLEECDTSAIVDLVLDRKMSLFENIDAVAEEFGLKEDVVDRDESSVPEDNSDFNICETCREVNKPEDREMEKEDVTTQLIENITSPIQLSNAVEVPLTEDNSSEREDIDDGQFEEISQITQGTIENIQVQSASEMLEEDEVKIMSFDWPTGVSFPMNQMKHNDYTNKNDPNSMSFFGDSLFGDNVPTNASDEIKAEYKHHEEILPRQMSIPSAPPAEEDSKSDEAGTLDVHSIELDAKEDFPIFEEFVIEPSETDDDKMEFKEREKSEESELDSFTNRVEKFKKMEEETDVEDLIPVPKYIELPTQQITMASYFDTGNYAADTHYRNINSPSKISIPPGFEEEFKKRLALAKAKEDAKAVPDTTTQTKPTVTISFSTAHTTYNTAHSVMPVGFSIEDNVSNIVEDTAEDLLQTSMYSEGNKASKTSSNFGSAGLGLDPSSSFSSEGILNTQNVIGSAAVKLPEPSIVVAKDTNLPGSSSLFNQSTVTTASASETITSEKPAPDKIPEGPKLPDPMNFFADSAAPAPTENFSRLASYFSTPPKTEHAKSFFELSQSQNHYRHAINEDKYRDLMKDLTSVQNLAVSTDQTIKHVNYFTVEYDVVPPESSKRDSPKDLDSDDKDFDILTSCRYCTNLIYDKRFKVRAAMNDHQETGNTVPTMEPASAVGRDSVTVDFDGVPMNQGSNEGLAALTENRSSQEYTPVRHHWFYRVDIEEKSIWRGFSVVDSRSLETAYLSSELNEGTLIPTDGGRYDVNIVGRLRIPVYWTDKPTNVRRCSWFYKGTTDPRYVPYTEAVADKLEEEYHHGITTGEWHRRLLLPNGEVVVMHGPSVMVHFLNSDAFSTPPISQLFSFGKRVYRNPPKIRVSRDQPENIDHLIFMVHGAGEYRIQKEKIQSSSRPRVVRRGYDESEIEDPEPSSIDHLLLLCHGVGTACDLRFRSVEEVVEDFRATSLQLVQSHYKNSYDQGVVSRVEVLPISWHATLHSGETGVDRRLAQITLDSIPRLRSFTNETVLDVLFYTSPVFCQTILDTVCKELNRIYKLFMERNPSFKGGVSLGGHSLGSVILYDLLCHQQTEARQGEAPNKSYVSGSAGTGQPCVRYPRLSFSPDALYALGSPIAIFECIRGVETLGVDFSLPTCKNFFNIFHPYDPIAYRIEPLINPSLQDLKPYLIPHHKGRKRMHLELKDTMARVGADIKQKLMESLRSTWNKWKSQPTDGSLERVVEEEMEKEQLCDETKEQTAKEKELSTPEMLGHLNAGRRVDYVLQEAPLEMINEYLFAMSSHVGYWESEDTMLLMLREIYSALGIQPDSTVPQQSMTVQRTRLADSKIMVNADCPSTSSGKP